ncbi:FkbM family methyltransferase [Thiohalophilus sp.]|uniref:FkbM family methyltransferase n=1 Tax=Thiohalophilus sp. TaxID=3028392 RepID=UPI002ACE8EE7|nr:FkbM family methyltransferase [Thiohalophilus sp.]MDZ7662806.1 FkbM family methyltransferase [Thiohalophilus sp.]
MWLDEAILESQVATDDISRTMTEEFMQGNRPRYLFGRNTYAVDTARQLEVDGFIDEFTDEREFLGKPIVAFADLPSNALVVSCVVGILPLTVKQRLDEEGIANIDYYAFQRYSRLDLSEVTFMRGVVADITRHREKYAGIYERLSDDASRETFQALVRFRLSRNLEYMVGFTERQKWQYFEEFLQLSQSGESFVDVGCYDGYTSSEFIRHCPDYDRVHVFEPEPDNMTKVKRRLETHERIVYHPYGASDTPSVLRFQSDGSSSVANTNGNIEIQVERIDDVIKEPFTFLKMDIEGGEIPALRGAAVSIHQYHPRLAVSVYHKADDLWTIPELVLGIRDDYDLYLRHYTEGVTETVMFFMPRR